MGMSFGLYKLEGKSWRKENGKQYAEGTTYSNPSQIKSVA
jgi:hypothetical protein